MNQSYKAYTLASHTVGKSRQVVMLYDGMVRFLQQAIEAIEKKDYETRYNKLSKVTEIVIGLQASLDMETGGKVAEILYAFYARIEAQIYAIHRTNDINECQSVMRQLKEMRDAWDHIDRGAGAAQAPAEAKNAGDKGDPVTVSA